MTDTVTVNSSSYLDVLTHLSECNRDFVPPLSDRVKLEDYAHKLATHATRFEIWSNGKLDALLAAYLDTDSGIAFISNVSRIRHGDSKGVATRLLVELIERCQRSSIRRIDLVVDQRNKEARGFYRRRGFTTYDQSGNEIRMRLDISASGSETAEPRRAAGE